jgi:hypothetical protein
MWDMQRTVRKHWCGTCHAWTHHLISVWSDRQYALCGRCHSGRYL